jgi:dTDP-4-dehydrorhamnose reductase
MGILVFGSTGQVATELRVQAAVTALGRKAADLTDPAACAAAVHAHRPRAVINAAAYTAVDRAEAEEDLATTINAEAPGAIARACADLGIPFLQISTDYVFSGQGDRPWKPEDPTRPLGAYGRSKLKGEGSVRAAGGVHAILRTSWVFSAYGQNFLKTMLRLGAERAALTVVADQIGGPTPARAIAAACLTIVDQLAGDPDKAGTYCFSGAPNISWAGFAREIMEAAGLSCRIDDIPTSAYPTTARRPANSRLDCTATQAVFGIERPYWRAEVRDIVMTLTSGKAQKR